MDGCMEAVRSEMQLRDSWLVLNCMGWRDRLQLAKILRAAWQPLEQALSPASLITLQIDYLA